MKIGFTCSAFDLFHAGHITMLRDAKEHCDFLIVGLQTDPTIDRPNKNKPVQSVYERWVQLSACQYVDRIIPYATEKELMDILQSQDINIRFVGEEYQSQPFTGKDIDGIEIYYNKRRHSFSSTELRQRVFSAQIKQDAKPAATTVSYQIDPYGKNAIDWPSKNIYNVSIDTKSHSDK
jgi:glycerol-3-phosphate cytidylyltransferase